MEPLNDHHFWFEQRNYRSKPLSYLRGLVIAKNVQVVWHNELHANVPPPPIPSRPLAYNLINHIEEHTYSQPLDTAFSTIDYLVKVGNHETIPIAENMTLQISYLIRGYDE